MHAATLNKDPSPASNPFVKTHLSSSFRTGPLVMMRFMMDAIYQVAIAPCFKKSKDNQADKSAVDDSGLASKPKTEKLEVKLDVDESKIGRNDVSVVTREPVKVPVLLQSLGFTTIPITLPFNPAQRFQLDAKNMPLPVPPSQLALIFQKLQKTKIIISKAINKTTLGVLTLTLMAIYLVKELRGLLVSELMGYDPQHFQLLSSSPTNCTAVFADEI